jgi:hypothetical protein
MAYPSEEITVRLRLLLRPLASDDLQKDFIPLLEQLSTIGHFSEEFFQYDTDHVLRYSIYLIWQRNNGSDLVSALSKLSMAMISS